MKRIIFFALIFIIPSILFSKNYSPFVLEKLGFTIYEGVFTGNGLLGTMSYLKSENSIRIDVGRTDVYDNRADTTLPNLFSKARLPIGHFEIQYKSGKIENHKGEINLNDANSKVQITVGGIKQSVIVTTLANQNIMIIELDKAINKDDYFINFIPSLSKSPRALANYVSQPPNYIPNPNVEIGKRDEVHYSNQRLISGGGYMTAYKIVDSNTKRYIIATISFSQNTNSYMEEAISEIKKIKIGDINKSLVTHKKWWNSYMHLSNYNIPDNSLQQFYDLQMYKLGCITRADKPMIDLQGPWAESFTPWPAYWYNLNMQLTYSPIYTANRLDLGKPLIYALDNNHKNLKMNIHADYRHDSYGLGRSGNGYLRSANIDLHRDNNIALHQSSAELSNLTWLLMSYYNHYKYSMNEGMRPQLYHLLKRSVNLALHFLDKKNGRYEFVVKTHSPEYSDILDYNTNYDLATLRWGIKTLLELGSTEEDDELYISKLKDIDVNLLDYPIDSTGYKISSNQSYDKSHRHYSHLMMIYPYYLIDYSSKSAKDLAIKSIDHWQSKKSALQGYSLSGAASMFASFGDGDKSLSYIKALNERFIQPNTLYKESGPVIETPLALANSIQELSLQCWQDTVRVFPAIPSNWEDVSFQNFRTEGAFLISASKKGEDIRVEIWSTHDGNIKLKVPIRDSKLIASKYCEILAQNENILHAYIPKGRKLIIEGKFNN